MLLFLGFFVSLLPEPQEEDNTAMHLQELWQPTTKRKDLTSSPQLTFTLLPTTHHHHRQTEEREKKEKKEKKWNSFHHIKRSSLSSTPRSGVTGKSCTDSGLFVISVFIDWI